MVEELAPVHCWLGNWTMEKRERVSAERNQYLENHRKPRSANLLPAPGALILFKSAALLIVSAAARSKPRT